MSGMRAKGMIETAARRLMSGRGTTAGTAGTASTRRSTRSTTTGSARSTGLRQIARRLGVR